MSIRTPHPHCGCMKPTKLHRKDGPCGHCLKDIDREYGIFRDPMVNKPRPTVDDLRAWRTPLLEATDWVETNPARVAREPTRYVNAVRTFRQQLFDITKQPGVLELPPPPKREDYL